MNHLYKTWAFKTLQTLPKPVGMVIYHWLQRIYNKHTVEESLKDHLRTLTRFERALNLHQLTFRNCQIVEIGSGWLPATPYLLLSDFKAANVWTYDIFSHYRGSNIRKMNSLFYHRDKKLFVNGSRSLPDAVKYFPNTNILQRPPTVSADAVVTRNVLEHVDPDDIFEMHIRAKSYLSDDAFIVHQISPSDHRAYYDKTLSLWDFLKYSDQEWNRIQTVFDYHNRLRLPQYIKIFENAGFDIQHCEYDCKKNASLPDKIHPDFAGFTTEELTAGSIIVVLRKKLK